MEKKHFFYFVELQKVRMCERTLFEHFQKEFLNNKVLPIGSALFHCFLKNMGISHAASLLYIRTFFLSLSKKKGMPTPRCFIICLVFFSSLADGTVQLYDVHIHKYMHFRDTLKGLLVIYKLLIYLWRKKRQKGFAILHTFFSDNLDDKSGLWHIFIIIRNKKLLYIAWPAVTMFCCILSLWQG